MTDPYQAKTGLSKRVKVPMGILALLILFAIFSAFSWSFGFVLFLFAVGVVAYFGAGEARRARAASYGFTPEAARSYSKKKVKLPVWAIILLIIAAFPFMWKLITIAFWLFLGVLVIALVIAVASAVLSRKK